MNRRAICLGGLTVCLLLAIMLVCITVIPSWLYPPLSAMQLHGISSPQIRVQLQQAQGQLANNARTAVLQGLGGLVLVGGAAATWWQVHISREGQITERFTRAVDQLGKKNVDVRIGGIYALERIAKNSVADRDAIQFLLGSFVRNHANWPVGTPDGPQHPTKSVDDNLPWLRVRAPDVQAAMGVLGRRAASRNDVVLYLSRVDLRSLSLNGAQMNRAVFRYSNLARAALTNVELNHADLKAADLRQASLRGSHLTWANLSQASLQGAKLRRVDLSHADLRGANLAGAILENTVLTGAILEHTVLTGAQARTTIWPTNVDAAKRRELGVIEVGDEIPAEAD
jgi:hypothetical protein